jgi:hypothetical protein
MRMNDIMQTSRAKRVIKNINDERCKSRDERSKTCCQSEPVEDLCAMPYR